MIDNVINKIEQQITILNKEISDVGPKGMTRKNYSEEMEFLNQALKSAKQIHDTIKEIKE